jgi:tetratricopeptide (TPR) repeat protein
MSLEEIKKLISLRQQDEAQRALLQMDARGESNAESQYLLGTIHHRKNELAQAVNCFKRALQLDPKFTDAAISLSVIYNDTGHYQEGKAVFQQAEKSIDKNRSSTPTHSIVLAKEIAQKHVELGNLYRSLERFDEAANEYLKASRLDSQNFESRILLAKIHAQRGQLRLAHEELQNLVKQNPNFVPARVHLALLYYAMGNTVDAQIELSEAHVKDPTNEQVKMYLAMTKQATQSTL